MANQQKKKPHEAFPIEFNYQLPEENERDESGDKVEEAWNGPLATDTVQ